MKEHVSHSRFAFPSPLSMTNKAEANRNPVIWIKELDEKGQQRRSTHRPYKLQLRPTSYKASMAKVRNGSPSCSQHTWFLFIVFEGLTSTSMWALNSFVNNTGNWLTFLQKLYIQTSDVWGHGQGSAFMLHCSYQSSCDTLTFHRKLNMDRNMTY